MRYAVNLRSDNERPYIDANFPLYFNILSIVHELVHR